MREYKKGYHYYVNVDLKLELTNENTFTQKDKSDK